jgi:hypothetical protein
MDPVDEKEKLLEIGVVQVGVGKAVSFRKMHSLLSGELLESCIILGGLGFKLRRVGARPPV